MTESEKEIMDLLVQAHNKFLQLDQTHPSDIPDWVNGVHSLQNVIASRIVRRDYPDDFITYQPKKS